RDGGADEHLPARRRDGGGGERVRHDVPPDSVDAFRSRRGSAERTTGVVAKFDSGAGDVVAHSRVWPFHGSSPASGASGAGLSTRPSTARAVRANRTWPAVTATFQSSWGPS